MGQFYPRWVRMADGSKRLVQNADDHADLTGTAKGESAKESGKAVAGAQAAPPPELTADTSDDPAPTVVTSDDVKRKKEDDAEEKAHNERSKFLGTKKK